MLTHLFPVLAVIYKGFLFAAVAMQITTNYVKLSYRWNFVNLCSHEIDFILILTDNDLMKILFMHNI